MHLSENTYDKHDFFVPRATTQEGMATALDVSRGHISFELARLMEQGHVECERRRVLDYARAVNAYRLTDSGFGLADALDLALMSLEGLALEGNGGSRGRGPKGPRGPDA